jgi:hypothetical protein
MTYLISIMWGSLILLSIWPPLSTLLPRCEGEGAGIGLEYIHAITHLRHCHCCCYC